MDPGSPVFDLFVTVVEAEGSFLKIWGQRDRGSAEHVERLIQQQLEPFEKGLGTPDPSTLKPGQVLCARYKDGCYYRAKILDVNVSNGLVSCLFLDYGNKEMVPFVNLRTPMSGRDALVSTIPAQAASFILSGVVGNWEPPLLKSVTDSIQYEEVKCMVMKSIGPRNDVHLLKLFFNGGDYLQTLQSYGATLMPPETFEMVLWNFLCSPVNLMSSSSTYGYPQQLNVMNSWPMWQQRMMAAGQNIPFQAGSPFGSPFMAMPSAVAPAVPGLSPVTAPPLANQDTAPLDMSRKSVARFSPIQLDDGSEHSVFVSYVENGSFDFSVQLSTTSSELEKLSSALQDGKFTLLEPPFMPGVMCLARFSEDDCLYRAVITQVESDKCSVYFVDYGNSESVKCDGLFQIPDKILISKPMAVPCTLAGLSSFNCTDEMKKVFHDIILEKDVILKVVSPNKQKQSKHSVELFIDETNVKELINLEILRKRPKLMFRNVPLPEVGSKLKVIGAFVKSFDNFYVQVAKSKNELESMMAVVAEHCNGPAKKMVESDIIDGAVCCALFTGDDQWYRAMVINADLNDLTVMYVDYGNEEKVSLGNLRHANENIVNKLRAQALPCRLSGFTDNSSEYLLSKFEDLVLDQTLTMHVIQFNREVPYVVVRLFDENGDDVTKHLSNAANNNLSSSTFDQHSSADTQIQDSSSCSGLEGGAPCRGPREEPTFNRGTRQDSLSSRGSREENFSKNPQEERSFNRGPPKEGSFSRGPREEGSFSRGPREEGSFSRGPREEGSFSRGPREEGSFSRGPQVSSRGSRQDIPGNRSSSGEILQDYSGSCPKKSPEAWGIGVAQNHSIGHCDRTSEDHGSSSGSYSRHNENRDVTKNQRYSSNHHAESWDDSAQVQSIDPLAVDVGVKKPVSIVYTCSPSDFYVHERPTDASFDRLMEEIENHFCEGGEPLPAQKRIVGGACVAQYSSDGAYYRARILELGNGSAEVFFVDYGNKEKVEFECLREIAPTMMTTKAQAIHCKLMGVNELSQSSHTMGFESLVDKENLEAEFVERDETDLYSIILRDSDCGQNGKTINEMFGATASSLLSPRSLVTSVQPRLGLSNGSDHDITVTWFQTPSKFFVQLKSSTDDFRRAMTQMQMDYKSKACLPNPSIGDAAVAIFKNDMAFYRCVIKVQKGEKYGVEFIDYGNRSLIEPSHIFGLEYQYSTCPAQAILCSLDGVLPLSGGDWIKNPDIAKCFDGDFKCTVVESSGNSEVPCVVRLSSNGQDLSESLIEKGLAVSSVTAPSLSHNAEPSEVLRVPSQSQPSELGSEPPELSEAMTPSECSQMLAIDPQMLVGQRVPACLNIRCSADNEVRSRVIFEELRARQLQEDLANMSPTDLVLLPPTNVVAGQKCLVQTETSEYKRAVIVDAKATAGVFVEFMDDCGVEECPASKIFVLPQRLEVVPPLSYEVAITNVSCEVLTTLTESNPKVVIAVESFDFGRFTGQVLNAFGQPLPCTSSLSTQEDEVLPMPIMHRRLPVTVVHACGSAVWLQQVSQADLLSGLLDDMFNLYEESGDLLNPVVVGSLCAAKSLADDNWYRAVVLEVSSEEVSVQYVDYGNSETLPLSNLKALSNFLDIPALAVKASLPLITETDLGSVILELAEGKRFTAVFVLEDKGWLVELLDEEQEEMSKKLINCRKAEAMECNALSTALVPTLYVGYHSEAVLSFIKSPSEFYVHLLCNSKKLDKLQTDLQILSDCMKPLDNFPEVGSKVMALYPEDNTWYRGLVMQDQVIHFLDYGNDEALMLSCLKSLPPAMQQVPSLATKCSLKAPTNKRWSQNATEKLELYLGGNFVLSVRTVINDTFVVNIKNAAGDYVSQLLAQEEFLEDESEGGECMEVIITSVESPGDFWVSLKNGGASLMHCALYLPSHFSVWSTAATSHFKELVKGSAVFQMVTLLPGDPTVVSLSINSRKIDLEVVALCSQKTWQQVPVEATVVFANSPCDFYIHLTRDSDAVQEMITNLEKASEFEPCSPNIGSVCAALYVEDDTWYRASILAEDSTGFSVKFIDYGNTAISTAIKELPHHLKEIPPLALHCALPLPDGTSGWSEAACDQFQDLLVEQFEVELLSSEEPFVANLMTRAGLNVAHQLAITSGIDLALVDELIAALRNSLQTVPSPKGRSETIIRLDSTNPIILQSAHSDDHHNLSTEDKTSDVGEHLAVTVDLLVEESESSSPQEEVVSNHLDESVEEISVAFDDSIVEITSELDVTVITIDDSPVKSVHDQVHVSSDSSVDIVPPELSSQCELVDLTDDRESTCVESNDVDFESLSHRSTSAGESVDDQPDSTFLCFNGENRRELECTADQKLSEVVSDVCVSTTSASIEESGLEVAVSLVTYANDKLCELDVDGEYKGHSLASASEFELDIANGAPGTRLFTFEDCEKHRTFVDVHTTD